MNQGMVQSREYIEKHSIPIPVGKGCWLWLLSPGSHGYGQAWCPEKRTVTTAHRIAYQVFVGDIPPGMLIEHSCDNKWCVNPDHLRRESLAAFTARNETGHQEFAQLTEGG